MKLEQLKRLKKYLYPAFVILMALACGALLIRSLIRADWHDFDVFYNAARAAMTGQTIYQITGKYNLPFWYVPWTAWFFIPFAVWPKEIGLTLYKGVTILCAVFAVHRLTHYYIPNFKFLDKVLIFSILVPMNLFLLVVGQMDYILLGIIVIIMYAIDTKKAVLAGILFPILWIKPHLMIVFTLFSFWQTGKKTVLISLSLSVLMLIIETIIDPNWTLEMFNLLKVGTQRTESMGFTTLPNLLGSQENWVGTANLPFTILLIISAILLVWKFRTLPTFPLLSLALAASLFCAPRAHAYDVAFLIPAIIWLTAQDFKSTLWIWLAAGLIPFLSSYSTNAYLLTLLIFILAIYKAHKTLATTSEETLGAA